MFNYDKLKEAILQSGKSKSFLCRKLDRPEHYLRDVLKQKNKVPIEYQEILAKELGVTVAWLNDEEEMSIKKAPDPKAEGLTAKQIELIELVKQLPDSTCDRLVPLVRELLVRQESQDAR